jgi:hypothetical protein
MKHESIQLVMFNPIKGNKHRRRSKLQLYTNHESAELLLLLGACERRTRDKSERIPALSAEKRVAVEVNDAFFSKHSRKIAIIAGL